MLDRMRRKARSGFTKILFGLLIVVFCFWGMSYGFFGQVHPVATVDGRTILAATVTQEADQLRHMLQQAYGDRAPAMLKAINLREEALQRLIEDQLMTREAQRLGITITNDEVQQAIAAQKVFQIDGRFDFQTYQDVLRQNGLLPAQYEAQMRSQMAQETLRRMVQSSVVVSDDEVRQAFDLANQNLSLRWFEVPYSAFTSSIEPSDKAVAKFYADNRQAFQVPDRVKLSYIVYSPIALAASYQPSDKDIAYYYKVHLKTAFTHPEQVRARHILIKVARDADAKADAAAKARAESILKKVEHGAKFAALARKYSEDDATANAGGELGFFARGQLVKPFEDAAFALKPGQATVVRTQFGWHVVQVEQIKPAHVDTLAQARPAIINDLREQAGKRTARLALDQDLSAALGGATLKQIAAKRGLTVVDTPLFAQGDQGPNLPTDRRFVAQAFKYETGQVGVITSGKTSYLVKLDARQLAHIPALGKIKAEVRQALIEVTAQTNAHKLAAKLLAQIKTPKAFAKVAAANKFPVEESGTFDRATRQVPGIGDFPEVTEAASALPSVPGVIDRVMEHEGNSFVFTVLARTPADQSLWDAQGKDFAQQYVQTRRARVWQRFLDALKTRAKIKIDASQLGATTTSSE